MSLPDVDVVRSRIEAVSDEAVRRCLMAAYLYAGRISEVVGYAYKTDNTVARGPRGNDARLDYFHLGDQKYDVVVFTVRTAKREGLERKIALPTEYESWASPLFSYFEGFGKDLVFPFYQQNVRRYCYENAVFKGLKYPIETYSIYKDGTLFKKVAKHTRPFTLHALRHLRATELVEYYGFTGPDLATYGGWTFHSMGFPTVADRYLSLGWQAYFTKLLKRRH